ncbi:NUDIX hydrolase [Leptonema illini]|uniref:NUDIX hydrolase n=1 Tax=Leptonema illini DSM 21528 TaxID=929563 RepID=H2CK77_9LEPT|nr:NUDIX hydrolase [Leptonema illini]EHQ07180.1 NUDIX hydrolase [Leptonema illini DSM 21528]
MKYCSICGGPLEVRVPDGDTMERYVCPSCGEIHYQNPRMIVGCLPVWNEKILLCKRAIEPRYGKWTIPAGFMELGERVEEGAMRETHEEANARVEILRLQTVYSIPHINQVYLLFLARLLDLDFHPGTETLETRLFLHDEIPWDEIAFSAVQFSLHSYLEDVARPDQATTHVGFFDSCPPGVSDPTRSDARR